MQLSKSRVCVYDFITKLCRQQAEVIQKHDSKDFHKTLDKVKSNTRNVIGLNVPAVKRTSDQVSDGRRNNA